jgi:predicted ATPase with chaperone activity
LAAEAHLAKIRAGGVKALSNADLQALNTRMQLEQTHRDLSAKRPSKFDIGNKHVQRILKTGKTLNDIHNTLNGPVGKAVKAAVKK